MNKKLLSENMKKIKEFQKDNQVLIAMCDLAFSINQVMVSSLEHKIELLETSLNIKDKQIQKLVKENLMLKAGIDYGK